MNTATRVMTRDIFLHRLTTVAKPHLQQQLQALVLVVAVLLTALCLIYVKDLNRRLFIGYQTQQHSAYDLHTSWGKLLLEESAWSTQARIQRVAERRLGMYVPTAKEIMMVKFKGA